jgi:hypothetical protein
MKEDLIARLREYLTVDFRAFGSNDLERTRKAMATIRRMMLERAEAAERTPADAQQKGEE